MIQCTQESLPINPIKGQTLYKASQYNDINQIISGNGKEGNQKYTLHNDNYHSINNEELQKKVNEFLASKVQYQNKSFDQYHDQFCVCPDCVYERKLSRPSHTLCNLTMISTYKSNFQGNSHPNTQEGSSSKLNKPNVDIKTGYQKQPSLHPKDKVSFQTIYNISMKGKSNYQKTKSLRKEDSLKFQGPFQHTTTYIEKFPGISGGNPYVKPVDKAVRDKFTLSSKTMNQSFYKGQMIERSVLARSPDNIRTGLPMLFKQSTSRKFYNSPINPQKYNTIYKSIPKRSESPKDKNQFESTYGKSFYGPDILEVIKHKKRLIRQTMSRLGM